MLVVFTAGKMPSDDFILRGLKQFLQLNGLADGYAVVREAGKKPYLTENGQRSSIDFSLSHSGEYILAAFSFSSVGADIQQHREVDFPAVSKRAFGTEIEDKEEFFNAWAAAEAHIKRLGAEKGSMKEFSSAKILPLIKGYSFAVESEDGAVFLEALR